MLLAPATLLLIRMMTAEPAQGDGPKDRGMFQKSQPIYLELLQLMDAPVYRSRHLPSLRPCHRQTASATCTRSTRKPADILGPAAAY